jgi:hypothetical protein
MIPLGLFVAALSVAALLLHLPLIVAASAIASLSLGYDMTQPMLAGIVTHLSTKRPGQAMGLNVFLLFLGFGLESLIFGSLAVHGFNTALELHPGSVSAVCGGDCLLSERTRDDGSLLERQNQHGEKASVRSTFRCDGGRQYPGMRKGRPDADAKNRTRSCERTRNESHIISSKVSRLVDCLWSSGRAVPGFILSNMAISARGGSEKICGQPPRRGRWDLFPRGRSKAWDSYTFVAMVLRIHYPSHTKIDR